VWRAGDPASAPADRPRIFTEPADPSKEVLRLEATRTQRYGEGWIAFAGVLFLILGTFNVIDGVVALAKDEHFADEELFFGSLSFWGVVLLIIGAIQILTSYLIFGRQTIGQILGIFMASFNLVAQMFFLPAFPIWSIIIMVVDALVIYGLTVYGSEFT
jgi:hypothetical protein